MCAPAAAIRGCVYVCLVCVRTCSRFVSFEFRYGTCFLATPSVSALTTPASALSELLMAVSSLIRSDPMVVSCAWVL